MTMLVCIYIYSSMHKYAYVTTNVYHMLDCLGMSMIVCCVVCLFSYEGYACIRLLCMPKPAYVSMPRYAYASLLGIPLLVCWVCLC